MYTSAERKKRGNLSSCGDHFHYDSRLHILVLHKFPIAHVCAPAPVYAPLQEGFLNQENGAVKYFTKCKKQPRIFDQMASTWRFLIIVKKGSGLIHCQVPLFSY